MTLSDGVLAWHETPLRSSYSISIPIRSGLRLGRSVFVQSVSYGGVMTSELIPSDFFFPELIQRRRASLRAVFEPETTTLRADASEHEAPVLTTTLCNA